MRKQGLDNGLGVVESTTIFLAFLKKVEQRINYPIKQHTLKSVTLRVSQRKLPRGMVENSTSVLKLIIMIVFMYST